MSRSYYKSNKTATGAMVTVSFAPPNAKQKDGCVFFKVIKQTKWDAAKALGSFVGGDSVVVKLSMFELGDLEETIRHRSVPFDFYHDGEGYVTSGKIKFYEVPAKTEGGKVRQGYSVYIKKGDVEYKSSLTVGEANDLLAYIDFVRTKVFDTLEVMDREAFLKRQEAKAKENGSEGTPQNSRTPKAAPKVQEPEAELPPDDNLPPEEDDVPF